MENLSESRVIKIIKFENKEESLKNNDFMIIENESLRKLENDEVLIKVKVCPISNLDVLKIMGLTAVKPIFTPGSEGSGLIVDALNKDLIGKKAAFFLVPTGCMREYIILNSKDILIINENIGYLESSIMLVNPLTAYGLVDVIRKTNAKCFIQDSANSAVGKIVYRLSKHYGLEVINIVRSNERVEEMKQMGCEYVLDMTDPYFETKLKTLSSQLGASVAIDSLSGDIVGILLKALPFGGILFNYGTQTKLPMSGIDATDLRWGQKEIKTYVVHFWLKTMLQTQKENIMNFIMENINSIFNQEIGIIGSMWDFYEYYVKFRTSPNKRCVLTN